MFKNSLSKIKKSFSLLYFLLLLKIKEKIHIPEKYTKENIFYSLSPRNDVDEDNIYYNKFMTAINNDCKIIAFTGKYGIGKTSIINSILKKLHNEKNNIRISLGNYRNAKSENESENDDETFIDSNDIETKILQQIIYTTNENKFPMSRFKRIKYISRLKKTIIAVVAFITMILVYVYFPQAYFFLFKRLYDVALTVFPKEICYSLCVILFLIIWYILYKLVLSIKTTINVSSLKYKDLEITITKDSDGSVFNKYLDEIVYFFKQTKTKILVIEDLDRYGNISLEVFKKLKELNFLLNSNETIKKHGGVLFIYALRDDLFLYNEDRVKFFDTIIPVVSKFSSQNAKEYIMELYQEFKNEYALNIEEKLLRIISIYIQDRRLLLNIFMEFKTYVDNLKNNQNINYTELFALISYKNINPVDFEKRLKYKGDLYKLFNYKDKLINILNSELLSKNGSITKEIAEMDKLRNLDILDLKKSFLLDSLKDLYFSNYINRAKLYIDSNEFSIDEFLAYKIDTNKLRTATFECSFPNRSKEKINSEIVKSFLDKVDNLNYDFIAKKEEITLNMEQIKNNEIKTVEEILNIDNLLELITDDSIKKIFANKLLISLVKNGFIKENYEKSLSFFKTGDLLPEDYNFLICVDTNDKLDFNYKLENITEIINIVDAKDFLKETLLNFDILDFLLKQGDNIKKKNLISQLKKINNYKLKFLESYRTFNEKNFTVVIKQIYNDELLTFIFQDDNIIKKKEEWFKIIIENINLDASSDVVDKLKRYMENNIDFLNNLEVNDISKDNIIKLNLNIENYDNVIISIVEIFYNNNTYKPNLSFYKRLIDLYDISIEYKEMDVINILYNDVDFIEFKNKVTEMDGFNQLYSSFKIYDSDEKNIIKALNDLKMKKEDKFLILAKENNKITYIDDVEDVSLWKDIIVNSHCNYSMENLISYYSKINEIDDTIIEFLRELGTDYHSIENDNLKSFEERLVYSESDSMINYSLIAKKFSHNIDSFDDNLEINFDLLNELINNGKINLNINTYNTLLRSNVESLIKLIINNIDEFINIKDEIELDDYVINCIMISDISITKKIQLFNNINIEELSKKTLSKIVDEIISNNIHLNDEFVEIIFASSLEEDKIKYFIYLYKLNSLNIKYLYKINDKISKIRNGSSTLLSFESNDSINLLLEYLYEINIINKIKFKNGKVYITYNRTKIM